ncbi:ATP-dependent Clp protease ATP-binding subunit [Candidatus Saccharibacteria bacterium]|nr:ATP-dependent Clp protease ATP-binding subunit [Candidatus Saccharibacteria bacterium]
MNNNIYNYSSPRAKSARASKILNTAPIKFLLIFCAIALLCLGIYLLIVKSSLGWLVASFSTLPFILFIYTVHYLSKVPVGKGNNINDLLSTNCLIYLGKDPTPQSIAKIIKNTRSGRFLAARFGITEQMLQFVTNGQAADATPVFNTALEIRNNLGAEVVSGGILAISLIQHFPDYENLLRSMKLSIDDLYQGINWYNHIYGLVLAAKKHHHTGGIGRDFAFGYTPTLRHFGQNISEIRPTIPTQIHQVSHQEILNRMVQIFSQGGRQNVALVGPDGSGRSTIVSAFADMLMDADSHLPANLKFRQIYLLDSAALISAANAPGEIETLLSRIFNEAYSAKNIIICLDNAHLFFEEGTGSVDISNLLTPILEAGGLRIILTMNEQKYLEISAKNSTLTNSLNKIIVAPASEQETMLIMQDKVPSFEYQHNVIFTYWALREAYRLSERYIHDLAMPGRALSLLETSADYPEQGKFITETSVQQAIEKTEGVKVQQVTTEADRNNLLNMEELIHRRMVNQESAVKTVSDALRRASVGVRNESRPIGTFLFLGPTGVGKTELAKSLSEVYFNGESQIVRIDLNEYVSENDVSRLIAEASKYDNSLTAQVMKRPFSVVLLDEIEKAHPKVLTTLLQMLDEGILRDSENHEVSFRDCIVIATSNAGANEIRQYISQGVPLDKVKDELVNQLVKSGEFKPEFLNRFDEICIFTPLSEADLLKVVDIIIAGVNQTLAPQKITVSLDDEAKRLLVQKGNDPMLGARPMRRIVQQTVENLVARMLLSSQISAGSTVVITAEMVQGD